MGCGCRCRSSTGTVWRFDLRFLLSHFHCIWGQGCRSVRGDGSSQGCCSHGVYVEGADWSDEDLWKAYIQLTEAEAAFRIHKSDLRLRPIWHQKKDRVLAHILVCFLAA